MCAAVITVSPRAPSEPAYDASAALTSIRILIAALTHSARTIEAHTGITNAQLFLLRQIAASDALSINELAGRARTRQNTVSSVVGRLADAGLVEKARSAADGRRAAVSLTRAGKRMLARAPASPTEVLMAGLDSLRPEEVRKLAVGLRALITALELTVEEPPMLFEDGRRTK
jgi:DNA-binding MarR family transcriptional regulator